MKPLFCKIDPSFFHGTAIATVMGLALGLALHGPWQDDRHGGGPQLLVASAASAELARPAGGGVIPASAPAEETVAYADTVYPDTSQLPPEPLPVTRLTRRGGAAIPAAAEVERVSDQVAQDDDVTTVGDFKQNDAPRPSPAHNSAYTPASYTQTSDGR